MPTDSSSIRSSNSYVVASPSPRKARSMIKLTIISYTSGWIVVIRLAMHKVDIARKLQYLLRLMQVVLSVLLVFSLMSLSLVLSHLTTRPRTDSERSRPLGRGLLNLKNNSFIAKSPKNWYHHLCHLLHQVATLHFYERRHRQIKPSNAN